MREKSCSTITDFGCLGLYYQHEYQHHHQLEDILLVL